MCTWVDCRQISMLLPRSRMLEVPSTPHTSPWHQTTLPYTSRSTVTSSTERHYNVWGDSKLLAKLVMCHVPRAQAEYCPKKAFKLCDVRSGHQIIAGMFSLSDMGFERNKTQSKWTVLYSVAMLRHKAKLLTLFGRVILHNYIADP